MLLFDDKTTYFCVDQFSTSAIVHLLTSSIAVNSFVRFDFDLYPFISTFYLYVQDRVDPFRFLLEFIYSDYH